MFALVVPLKVKPEMREKFLAAALEDSTCSVRDEPGCLRFDVLTSEDGASPQVVLYEIYTDRAAFDRHLAMPHYLDFDQRTRAAVRNKAVRFFCLREAAC